MAQYGVSITKRVSFRGGAQHFSNTYNYEGPLPPQDLPALNSLVDQIVAQEKLIHSLDVTFVHARLWSSGGTKAENNMLIDKQLSGAGARAVDTALDRERAILIQFAAGKDVRGRPVKLRKWFHVCGALFDGASSAAMKQQTASLPTSTRNGEATQANFFRQITASNVVMTLCANSGRDVQGDATCHPWLEHHQLGDEWRGF